MEKPDLCWRYVVDLGISAEPRRTELLARRHPLSGQSNEPESSS